MPTMLIAAALRKPERVYLDILAAVGHGNHPLPFGFGKAGNHRPPDQPSGTQFPVAMNLAGLRPPFGDGRSEEHHHRQMLGIGTHKRCGVYVYHKWSAILVNHDVESCEIEL